MQVRYPFIFPLGQQATQRRMILEHVSRNAAQIRSCYDQERVRQPELGTGQIQLSWTIDAEGKVTGARVVRDSLVAPRIWKCLVRAINGWRFPPTARGCRAVWSRPRRWASPASPATSAAVAR